MGGLLDTSRLEEGRNFNIGVWEMASTNPKLHYNELQDFLIILLYNNVPLVAHRSVSPVVILESC